MSSIERFHVVLCFSCFFFFIFMGTSFSESDSLTKGQRLSDGSELLSAYKTFRLGFVSPSNTVRKRYLGIWYNQPDEKMVWVANRKSPIFDNSGVLELDIYSRLQISYHGGDPIVLSSLEDRRGYTIATLLDSGNFVLREMDSNGSVIRVLWQSFDYPTDTLLPGMKLGFNLKTGHQWSISSWITKDLAAPGSFTLGMDPNGTDQMIIWWRGDIFWSSGQWLNGHFNLSNGFSYHFHFSFVSNENEKYFSYSVNKDAISFPRLWIDSYGNVWGPRKDKLDAIVDCDPPSNFPAQFSVGCEEKKFPKCRSPHDRFVTKKGIMPGDGFKFNESDNMGLIDCHAKCLKDCSCVAFASTYDNGTGCEIWRKLTSLKEFTAVDQREIYVFEYKAKRWVWPIIATAGALVLIFVSCSYYYIQRKYLRAERKNDTETQILLYELGAKTTHRRKFWEKDSLERDGKKDNELQFFSFESITSATDNFAATNKLGEGGYGSVYKGKLHNGQEIAIKRLSRSSGQGLLEFKNEAILISKLQHTNLVRLVGCCIHKEEKILIYEYMPNKSLDFFLFDPQKKNTLDWKKRFNIIEGIAQGLLYLHKYSRLKIIHRDLKASNVLLDDNLNPKISDFGMARIFGPNDVEVNTSRVVGTYGYMSPEYIREGIFSTKSDVFSYGVLLLEIVSGKKNHNVYDSERPLNLTGYAWELWREGKSLELMDPNLVDSSKKTEVLRCIHVGLLCVQEAPSDRPDMGDAISMMYKDTSQLPTPQEPAFFTRRNLQEAERDKCRPQNCSLNGLSISDMKAR